MSITIPSGFEAILLSPEPIIIDISKISTASDISDVVDHKDN